MRRSCRYQLSFRPAQGGPDVITYHITWYEPKSQIKTARQARFGPPDGKQKAPGQCFAGCAGGKGSLQFVQDLVHAHAVGDQFLQGAVDLGLARLLGGLGLGGRLLGFQLGNGLVGGLEGGPLFLQLGFQVIDIGLDRSDLLGELIPSPRFFRRSWTRDPPRRLWGYGLCFCCLWSGMVVSSL